MQIQINAADPQTRDANEGAIASEVNRALGRWEEQITRVEVHLKDLNGPRDTQGDKQCTIEARLAGLDPMTVTATADQLLPAVSDATSKLQRMITSELGKRGRR